MTLLVRTPAPQRSESLFGYILRIAEANGYDSPWHVLKHAGLSQGEMRTAGIPVDKLAAIVGRRAKELQRIAYSATDDRGNREFKLLGHSLGKGLSYNPLKLNKPSFCPHCVQERGYIDAFFDLNFAVACPIHQCVVLNQCPSCQSPLTWFRPGLLTCKCGACLADTIPEPAAQPVTDLMAVLWAKLHDEPISSSLATVFPVDQLLGLPLRSLLLKLPALGTFNHPEAEGHALQTAEAVADVLADWPKGFYRFLARLGNRLQHAHGDVGFGFRKQFQSFYSRLFLVQSCGKQFDWLRDEFIRFGLEYWGGSAVDNRMLQGGTGNRRFVNKTELAKMLKVSPVTLGNWNKKGLLDLKVVRAGKSQYYVADSHADELTPPISKEGAVLGIRAAAAFLGIPVCVLNEIKETGDFPVQHRLRQRQGFHQADLENFRQQLLERSPLVPANELPSDLVDLSTVLREFRFHDHRNKAGFIKKYLAGDIQSPGRTGNTLADIQFRRSEIAANVASCRSAVAGGSFSVREVAARMRINPCLIPGLIALGYLTEEQGREGIRISMASALQFEAKFVSLSSIATDWDSSSTRLKRLCIEGNIQVLSILRSSGRPGGFIERKDVTTLRKLSDMHPSRPTKQRVAKKLHRNPIDVFQRYLAELQRTQTPLPRRGLRPHRILIAKACGFSRCIFYNRPEITQLIEDYAVAENQAHTVDGAPVSQKNASYAVSESSATCRYAC